MAKTTFTRKEFYDLVWTESLAAISRKYFISYLTLKEVCTEMNIPLPENGYWSKLKFGKPIELTKLDVLKKGKQEIALWLRSDEDGEECFSGNNSHLKKNKSKIAKNIKPLETKIAKISTDPLIARTREYLTKERDYSNWNYDLKKNTLNISVSKDILPRALEVMNRFIHMIKDRGYSVIEKHYQTYVVINNEELEISLRERSTRTIIIAIPYNHSELKPTGKLVFKYSKGHYGREWADNSILIEDRLTEILSDLEIVARIKKYDREEDERRRVENIRLEIIRKELQARKEDELKNFKNTFQLAKRYQKADDLRKYINIFEENAIKNNTLTEEKQNWIEWARKKADWYDPFINAKDELLEDVDKDSLTFKNQRSW